MESSSDGERNHTIKIREINKDQIAKMHQKISELPEILNAGGGPCSIFKVPKKLMKNNDGNYQPHIVSIGPYHRGEPPLKLIEGHKWRCLGSLLFRIETTIGIKLEDLLSAMAKLEDRARKCYSETILLSSDEFSEMMILDGCFVIELIRKDANLVRSEQDDPIITMPWIIPFFERDFLLLENQIPFFVLDELFKQTQPPLENQSLHSLALKYFKKPQIEFREYAHLLHLVRSSLIPSHLERSKSPNTRTSRIPSVSKLRLARIKLNPSKAESFLDISFKDGIIQMPPVAIDNFMTSFLLNCVAFEQCYRFSSKHFTVYATLLDCLVNTYMDVEYLSDQNIFENCLGNNAEVERFVNKTGKELVFDINSFYLAELFDEVHQHYRKSWHVQWASFKSTYFDTPWSFISALAALILLLLTMAQTLYTIYGYYNHR